MGFGKGAQGKLARGVQRVHVDHVHFLAQHFFAANQVRFHDRSGRGYAFLADIVLDLDKMNPQIAARMVSQFNQWKCFDPARRELMQGELQRIASQASLSKDVFEIVERALSA
jgi:aminopeptidase N